MIRSPTVRLLLGLLITMGAAASFCAYALQQINYVRSIQTGIIDRNRHDSLLLLRVQTDIDELGLKLQQITEIDSPVRIAEYQSQLARVRADLASAMRADDRLATVMRRAGPQATLRSSLDRFWNIWDQVYRRAEEGREAEARRMAADELSSQQVLLAQQVSQILEDNNKAEARADSRIQLVYANSRRQTYVFLSAIMATIFGTSLYLVYSNRRTFARLQHLSQQRRVLAGRLFTVQEEVLRSVSRELHDEFGQILTAIGTLLARAERKGLPADSPFRTDLAEVREITHNTLERMRSLSQMLHPAILDDYGLVKAIEWYAGVFERQTGIETRSYVNGRPVRVAGDTATHCFRIVQEALTNVAKHSGAKRAEVRMFFEPFRLRIEIVDFGKGMPVREANDQPGLGLIAMRERAELVHGSFEIDSSPAGTAVSLSVPVQDEPASERESQKEEVTQES